MRNKPQINAIDTICSLDGDGKTVRICIQLIVTGIPRVDALGSTHTGKTTIFKTRERVSLEVLRSEIPMVGPAVSWFSRFVNARRRAKMPAVVESMIAEINRKIAEHNELYQGQPAIPLVIAEAGDYLVRAAINQAEAMARLA